MTIEDINRKAKAMVQGKTTEDLLEYWLMTTTINDAGIPTVRGWIMDELEARFPEVYNEWLDSDDFSDDRLAQMIRATM